MSLTPTQIDRHKRHILLKEIGGAGVQKLLGARVSIVGAGALGGPCALYLAAAGVGEIEIWDDDHVDRSNLQRQVQFGEADIGRPKVECLAGRLKAINSDLKIIQRCGRFSSDEDLSGSVLIDATDNFETRFALNETAHTTSRFLVSGAASKWSGQVSVFASGVQENAPCYRCFVPDFPPEAEACDDVGVLGALTGMIGSMMALEALKLLSGAGQPLIGKIALVEGLSADTRIVSLRPDPDCQVCSA